MLRLALAATVATLENFNPRVEKSGKEKVPATDLKISTPQSADVLEAFSPGLKALLFDLAGPRDLADGLPLRDTHMVFPIKRDEEMTGVKLTIDYGVNNLIQLVDVKLKDFQLTPMEGGTVVVVFTAQCKPDADREIPLLYKLQEQGITISLTPAELPEMKDAA